MGLHNSTFDLDFVRKLPGIPAGTLQVPRGPLNLHLYHQGPSLGHRQLRRLFKLCKTRGEAKGRKAKPHLLPHLGIGILIL